MAAFTGSPASSNAYLAHTTGSAVAKRRGGDAGGPIRYAYAEYTHAAGAGTGEINMLVLPPGRIRTLPNLSRLATSQFAASSTVDVGFRAYTEPDGDAITEDDNAWEDNRDTASGVTDAVLEFGGDGSTTAPVEFNSRAGIIVFVSVDSGNIEDGDTIKLGIAYTDVG